MIIDTSDFKTRLLGKNLDETIRAIEESDILIDEITSNILVCLENSKDRLVISEKMSLLFEGYLDKLKGFLEIKNAELNFWAATLIINCSINNGIAENILLKAVQNEQNLEQSFIATTILCKSKNKALKSVIEQKLKNKSLSLSAKTFFTEKLEQLKH
jgi:hypothetical protein